MGQQQLCESRSILMSLVERAQAVWTRYGFAVGGRLERRLGFQVQLGAVVSLEVSKRQASGFGAQRSDKCRRAHVVR